MTGKRLRQLIVVVFDLAILIAIAVPILAQWPTARQALRNAHGAYLYFSWLILIAGALLVSHAWREAARAGGAGLSYLQTLNLYTGTSLAGRLPGPIWPLIAAASFGQKTSLGPWQAMALALYEQVYLVLAGFLFLMLGVALGAWRIPFVQRSQLGFALGGALLILMLLHPRALRPVLKAAQRWLKRPNQSFPLIPWNTSVIQLGYHSFNWGLQAAAFIFFVQWLTGPLDFQLWMPLAAAFCASHLIGMLFIVTPQGLGVREGALALLLSQNLPAAMAGLIALLARAWSTLGMVGLHQAARWLAARAESK